jgi:hypothetical protein
MVADDHRVNAGSVCLSGGYFNCSGEPGFKWSDTLSAETEVARVAITFQMGYEYLDVAVPHTGSLNGGADLSYANTATYLACKQAPDKPTTLIFPGADYILGGDNTFLSTNPAYCLGFANLQSGNAAGNWAEVCVFAGVLLLVMVSFLVDFVCAYCLAL